jgi:hypothetical protein
MKKNRLILATVMIIITLTACGTEAPADEVVENSNSAPLEETHDHSDLFPYLGIWFSADRTSQLIITEAYLYYHEYGTEREVYSEIEAADLTENTIDVLMYSIIHGGQPVGFDSPAVTLSYQVSGEQMEIELGKLSLNHINEPVVFIRDEVLNE